MDRHTLDAYYKALTSDAPLNSLRAMLYGKVKELGRDRTALLEELEALRRELRAAGRADDEDLVLDVMDLVTGWCRPSMRI